MWKITDHSLVCVCGAMVGEESGRDGKYVGYLKVRWLLIFFL